MSGERGPELVQDHVQHGLPRQTAEERLGGGERTVLGELIDGSPATAEREVRTGPAALLDSLDNISPKRGKARRGNDGIERIGADVAEREIAVSLVSETQQLGGKRAEVSLPGDRNDREGRGLVCPHPRLRLGSEESPG